VLYYFFWGEPDVPTFRNTLFHHQKVRIQERLSHLPAVKYASQMILLKPFSLCVPLKPTVRSMKGPQNVTSDGCMVSCTTLLKEQADKFIFEKKKWRGHLCNPRSTFFFFLYLEKRKKIWTDYSCRTNSTPHSNFISMLRHPM
jgi:hypothetical protein